MSVDQFIHDTGLKMDRPVHVGKRVHSWATGLLPCDEYDRWYAVLEMGGKEIPVYWDSSIRQCSECYIPNLLDFMEKVQAVLFWAGPDEIDRALARAASVALGESIDAFMDLDIHYAIEKEVIRGSQNSR